MRPANADVLAPIRSSSALATSTVCRRGVFENLGFRVRDGVDGAKEPHVRIADIGPDADVRPGDADERANLARVVHAQLDDSHVRPRRQPDERQRQPDVVVEIPVVSHHAILRFQKRRCHFLRRGLARAAGDRHHFRARRRSNRRRQRLQRDGRIVRPRSSRPRRSASPRDPGRRQRPRRRSRPRQRRSRRRRTARPESRCTPRPEPASANQSIRRRTPAPRPRSRASRPWRRQPIGPSAESLGPRRGLQHARVRSPPRQRLACDGGVVKRQLLVPDHLVLLVPLARHQHQIPGAGEPDGLRDGGATIRDR